MLMIFRRLIKKGKQEEINKVQKEKKTPQRYTKKPCFVHKSVEQLYKKHILGNVFFIGYARDEIIGLLERLDRLPDEKVDTVVESIIKSIKELDGTYINRKALVLLLTRASQTESRT